MKKTVVIMFLLSCMLAGVAIAQPNCITKANYLAAISEELFEEATGYLAQRDFIALQKLLDSGWVVMLKAGIPVYIEDTKLFGGKVKIRPVGFTTGIWTHTEAVDCKN